MKSSTKKGTIPVAKKGKGKRIDKSDLPKNDESAKYVEPLDFAVVVIKTFQ